HQNRSVAPVTALDFGSVMETGSGQSESATLGRKERFDSCPNWNLHRHCNRLRLDIEDRAGKAKKKRQNGQVHYPSTVFASPT
ncbi:Bgt-20684, partial [Blumeria graminis f. sp. tritici]